MAKENMHSEEVYVIGLPSLYAPIPVRTVIQECEIRRRVRLSVRAIDCPELRIDLRPYGLLLIQYEVMFLVSLSSQIAITDACSQ